MSRDKRIYITFKERRNGYYNESGCLIRESRECLLILKTVYQLSYKLS